MTVGELIAILSKVDKDLNVNVMAPNGYYLWDLEEVNIDFTEELDEDDNPISESRETVNLIGK
jgi:hypothetical protein